MYCITSTSAWEGSGLVHEPIEQEWFIVCLLLMCTTIEMSENKLGQFTIGNALLAYIPILVKIHLSLIPRTFPPPTNILVERIIRA